MSDPEDLEDGEIEDDDEEEVVVAKPEDPPLGQPMPNDADDFDELSAPNASLPARREEHHASSGKGGQQQRQRASNKPAPVVDDWATKVESAIAKELIKDGVEPPMPSVALAQNEEDGPRSSPSGGGSRKSKKRKKSSRGGGGSGGGAGGDLAQPSIKQQRLNDDAGELGEQDLEYEMLNMRGGSPQQMAMGGAGNIPDGMSGGESENDTHYSSDESSSVRDHQHHHHHHHHRTGGAGDRDHRGDRERDRDREREQRLAERERDRERDREYNRNKRKQQKQQQQQARQRNAKSNRDNRKRKRDDSDDEKHRPTGPRKMELCKFYLMDCCAKREKCLYMHKDFPCKYYYLGMKCKEKELCHFSHGEPLTNDLRAILLKHLETAPQEILGSFQRISRDTANNLLNATHRKLMEKYGRGGGDGGDGDGDGMKIPSLMDGMHGGGNSRQQQQQQQQHHHHQRKRWCDEPNRRTPDDEEDRMRQHHDAGAEGGGPLGLHHLTGVITRDQINDLEQMGIRTLDEISQLTVAQLNDLGLSITQIHDLQVKALSMKRPRDSSVDGGGRGKPEDRLRGERTSLDRSGAASAKDLDMRIKPQSAGTSHPLPSSGSALNEPTVGQPSSDVDMRVFPPNGQQPKGETATDQTLLPSPLLPLKPPTVDYSQYIKDSNLDEEDLDAVAAANPVLLNPDEEEDDDDDDDDENNLKINIEEEEEEQKKDQEEEEEDKTGEQEKSAPLLPPLVPPKIDYAQGLGDLLLYGSLDKTASTKPSSVSSPRTNEQLSPTDGRTTEKEENGSSKLDLLNSDEIWTPSMSLLSSSSSSGGTASAPVIAAPAAEVKPKPVSGSASSKRRTTGPPSIYDWDDSDNVSSPDGASSPVSSTTPFRYGSSDRALPLNINDDEDEDDVAGGGSRTRDLGLPFKPMMANYVPATEIDGSIGSHATIIYKVYVVDVPKPNFKSLRRSMQRPMGTRDPRLRRLFGLHSDEEDAKDSHDDGDTSEGIKSPDATSSIASPPYGVPSLLPTATGATVPPLASPQPHHAASSPSSATRRVDPRKRHAEKMAAAAAAQQQQDGAGAGFGPGGLPPPPSSSTGPNAPPQLDVQTILQRSTWYKDLGTKHKIMVNQQLAILSTEMKKYHSSDRSTEALSEFMKFLGTNSMLQHILTCLNVYVDHTVAFCEVATVPRLQSPPSFPLLANIPPPIVGAGGPGPGAPGGGAAGGGMPLLSVPVHIPPPLNVQQPPPLGLPPLGNPLTSGPPPPFLNHNNGGGGGGGGPGPGGGGNNGPPASSRFGPPLSQHEGPPGPGGMGPLPPGLLGIAPNMPFEQFLAMGNINKGGGGGGGGDHGGGNIPPWTQGNGNNHMRNNSNNMRNNNRIGHNFRNNNDRWANNGGGGGGGGNNGGGGNGNNRRNNRRMDRKK